LTALQARFSLLQALNQQQSPNQTPNNVFSLSEVSLSKKRKFLVPGGRDFSTNLPVKAYSYAHGESSKLSRATIRVASLF
jgi:hypothetical protein